MIVVVSTVVVMVVGKEVRVVWKRMEVGEREGIFCGLMINR